MANTNIGYVSISPKGEWLNSRAYHFLSLVTNGGNSYLAIKDVTAGTPLTDSTAWLMIAAKGGKGDKGDQGIQGIQGVSIDFVQLKSTSGNVDTYSVMLTDGTEGGTFTVTNANVVQSTGQSTSSAMSQKAVTDELGNKVDKTVETSTSETSIINDGSSIELTAVDTELGPPASVEVTPTSVRMGINDSVVLVDSGISEIYVHSEGAVTIQGTSVEINGHDVDEMASDIDELSESKIDANIIDNQSITLAQVKAIVDDINANDEHAFFDVSALGAAMYLVTIYIDSEKYKIFDLVSGRFTEGVYDGTKLLTMCLVAAEPIATQSQIDHLQDEINELGGAEKIKDWKAFGDLIEAGTSTDYVSAGDRADINWMKSVLGTTTHGLTVTCSDIWAFAFGVDEAEAKDYYFVYNGTNWTYNEEVIDLADFGLSVSGTPVAGEVMTITTAVETNNYTLTGYDDFEAVNPAVPHNWCLEQTYAPTTKAYDTYESLFNLAQGKTLAAGNYKLTAPHYNNSPMITVYFTVPSAVTATDGIIQFASTGYQNVACIPGSETKYYIASNIRPAYRGSNSYLIAAIPVKYNQDGEWTDISAVDGITITDAHIQAALGNNCPAHCNLRQWLNDESQNGHYEATNAFDRPSSYNFTRGFLYGIDPRVYALIQPCKTKFTAGYNNEGYTQGTVYENEDKVFLLSMKEMSFNIQTGEGNVTDLYDEYCEGVLTNNAVAARAKYNKAGGTLNSYRWSRSAYSSSAHNARGVTSTGASDYCGAYNAYYVAPAFIIGKASENQ